VYACAASTAKKCTGVEVVHDRAVKADDLFKKFTEHEKNQPEVNFFSHNKKLFK